MVSEAFEVPWLGKMQMDDCEGKVSKSHALDISENTSVEPWHPLAASDLIFRHASSAQDSSPILTSGTTQAHHGQDLR